MALLCDFWASTPSPNPDPPIGWTPDTCMSPGWVFFSRKRSLSKHATVGLFQRALQLQVETSLSHVLQARAVSKLQRGSSPARGRSLTLMTLGGETTVPGTRGPRRRQNSTSHARAVEVQVRKWWLSCLQDWKSPGTSAGS